MNVFTFNHICNLNHMTTLTAFLLKRKPQQSPFTKISRFPWVKSCPGWMHFSFSPGLNLHLHSRLYRPSFFPFPLLECSLKVNVLFFNFPRPRFSRYRRLITTPRRGRKAALPSRDDGVPIRQVSRADTLRRRVIFIPREFPSLVLMTVLLL